MRAVVAKKRSEWARTIGEVLWAIRSDPMLLAPAILTIVIALAVAVALTFLWR